MFARLSGFDSAKQGTQKARKAGSSKTTRKTCHRRRQAREARSPESRKLQDNTQDVPSAPGDKSDDG